MAFGWSKNGVLPIAVDFGFKNLKLLQISPGDPPQMVAAAAAEVPDEARHDPALRHAAFADSLRQLLADQPFKGRRAICSIPAYQTLVQNFQIGKGEHEEVDAQVDLYLRQRLNVDPSRMVVRSFCVGDSGGNGSAKQEVVCIAASREVVMRYIDIVRRAKLDVVGMHCEPLAIIQSFAYLYRRKSDEMRTTCFVDIGAATTKVIVAHGARMVFAKTIHAAGDQLSCGIAKSRSIDAAEARRQRRDGVGAAERQTQTGDGSTHADAAPLPRSGLAVIDAPDEESLDDRPATEGAGDAFDCLIDELRLSIRYHQNVFPDRPIEKLVFLGGEARHVDTCQKVAKAMKIGAQLGDPLSRMAWSKTAKAPMGVNLHEPQPGWAVPIGLCQCEANM